MANGNRYGLFGAPSPNDIMQNIGRIDPADVGMANAGINAPAAVGLSTRHLAQPILGMFQQMSSTNKLKDVFSSLENTDDPEKYYTSLVGKLREKGMYKEAMQGLDKLLEIRAYKAAADKDQAAAAAKLADAQTDRMKAAADIQNDASKLALKERETVVKETGLALKQAGLQLEAGKYGLMVERLQKDLRLGGIQADKAQRKLDIYNAFINKKLTDNKVTSVKDLKEADLKDIANFDRFIPWMDVLMKDALNQGTTGAVEPSLDSIMNQYQ